MTDPLPEEQRLVDISPKAYEHPAEEEHDRVDQHLDEEALNGQRPRARSHARVQCLDQRRHPGEQQTEARLQERQVHEEEAEQREGDATLTPRDDDACGHAHGHGRGVCQGNLVSRERRAEHSSQYRNGSAPGMRPGSGSPVPAAISRFERTRSARRGRPSGQSATPVPERRRSQPHSSRSRPRLLA